MRLLQAIPDGQPVELLLVRSANNVTDRQRGTLRSMHLDKHTGARSHVRNNADSTPGMLHQVRHLVAVKVQDDQEDGSNGSRTPNREGTPTEEPAVTAYTASGGASALLVLADWPVRVEAHDESFALVWPAHASLEDLLRWVGDAGAGAEVLLGGTGGPPSPLDWTEAVAAVSNGGARPQFVRIDLDDTVLTWSQDLRQLPEPAAKGDVHEIGLGAEVFDERLVLRLLEATAVPVVAEGRAAIVSTAHTVLANTPSGTLALSG